MKVRLMIIIGVISFLLGGCNKIQKNSNQVQLVQRTEEILVESEDLADDYFHIYKERWNQSNRNSLKLQQDIMEYFIIISKQFLDLTLCNSANGGKACIYGLFRHLLYGRTIRI